MSLEARWWHLRSAEEVIGGREYSRPRRNKFLELAVAFEMQRLATANM